MKHVKKAINAHAKRLGGETPLLGIPLVGRTLERVLAEVARVLTLRPDLVEWRVDHFEAVADTSVVLSTLQALRDRLGKLPLVLTLRSAREGGEPVALSEAQVVALYEAVAATRLVDFLDFEMYNDPAHVARVRAFTKAHKVRLILSYHNFSYTPGLDYLMQQFLEAERLGADVAMVSVMPRDRADVLTLLQATEQADRKTHIPLISMAMGPLGAVSRMVGGLFGSGLTYGVGETASAPGQIPAGDLVTVFDIIRRSRGGEMF
jgi:3-dehydroquinate dehydratase-1